MNSLKLYIINSIEIDVENINVLCFFLKIHLKKNYFK